MQPMIKMIGNNMQFVYPFAVAVLRRGWGVWEGNIPPPQFCSLPLLFVLPSQMFSLADLCLYTRVIIVYYWCSFIDDYIAFYNVIRDIFRS